MADSLNIKTETTIETLHRLLAELKARSEATTYKQHFPWIDHLSEVRNKEIAASLDEYILERIQNNQTAGIWMAVPSVVEWDRIDSFRYSKRSDAVQYYDVRLGEFIENLPGGTLWTCPQK